MVKLQAAMAAGFIMFTIGPLIIIGLLLACYYSIESVIRKYYLKERELNFSQSFLFGLSCFFLSILVVIALLIFGYHFLLKDITFD